MKRIFIDINILMDVFAKHEPFIENSLRIYTLGFNKNYQLYTSSNTITTLHYLLKKVLIEEKIRMVLENILEKLLIIPVDSEIIRKSLKSNHKDFEDAIQIYSAQSIDDMNCIVTRDLKDYKNTAIQVYTPDQFLNQL